MKALEIIQNFTKGASRATISEKQKAWLVGQAKQENLPVVSNGFSISISLNGCKYTISQCTRLASGGSYVGSKSVAGRFNIEKLYTVRFRDTGIVEVCDENKLEYIKRGNYSFELI